jgi:hypothetical protein
VVTTEAQQRVDALAAAIARVREQRKEEATLTEGARVQGLQGKARLCWSEARAAAENAAAVLDKVLADMVLPTIEQAQQALEAAEEASLEAASASGGHYEGRVSHSHWPAGVQQLLPHLREYRSARGRVQRERAAMLQAEAEHTEQARRQREQDDAAREHLSIPVEVRNAQKLSRLGVAALT